MQLAYITLLVEDCDTAAAWFKQCLGFKLLEGLSETPTGTLTVQAPEGGSLLVLAKAENTRQRIGVGNQFAGRVGFSLKTSNFDAAYERLVTNLVRIVSEPQSTQQGQVATFQDKWGNQWQLVSKQDSSQ